ncbi:MAG: MFS transporter, partial [Chloroflexota bacterium]
ISLGNNVGFFQAVATAVNSWFIRSRAMAMSIISAGSGLGGFILAPLFSFLVLNLGWRSAAIVVGLIVLLALPAALELHRSPESRGLLPDGDVKAKLPATTKPVPLPVDFTVREALHTSAFWLLTLAVTTRMMVTAAIIVHMVPIMVWKNMDEAGGAYMVSLLALGSIGSRLLLGWISDRSSKPLISASGAVVGLLGLVALLFAQSAEMIYVFVLGLAFTEGTIPVNWVIVGDFFGRKSFATLRGLMSMVYSAGVFISPIYAGWIFDITRSYDLALVTFCVIFALSAIVFAILRNPSPPKRDQAPQCEG